MNIASETDREEFKKECKIYENGRFIGYGIDEKKLDTVAQKYGLANAKGKYITYKIEYFFSFMLTPHENNKNIQFSVAFLSEREIRNVERATIWNDMPNQEKKQILWEKYHKSKNREVRRKIKEKIEHISFY